MSDTPTTEQSMDETLKELERQLADGDKPEDQPPQSAEILNLADAAGDSRKSRSQSRGKGSPGAEQGSAGPEAVNKRPTPIFATKQLEGAALGRDRGAGRPVCRCHRMRIPSTSAISSGRCADG